MVESKIFIRVSLILISLVIALGILAIYLDKKNIDREKEYAVQNYKLTELERDNKQYKILDQQQKRIQDSLKIIITALGHEKEKIKYKYIVKRDSIISLPIDQSMQFFSINLPSKDSH